MWPDRTDEVGAFLLFLRLALTVARVRWNNEIIRELCKAEACEIAPGQGIDRKACCHREFFLDGVSPERFSWKASISYASEDF